MVELSSKIALFRVSAAILVIGLKFLACLVGKLVKEQSVVVYNGLYSLCTGILLACGLSSLLVDIAAHTLRSTALHISLFSLPLVSLVSYQITFRMSSYQYAKLDQSVEDDNDFGVTVSEDAHHLRPETGSARPQSSSEDDVRREQLFWQRTLLSALVVSEISNGLVVGSEEHSSAAELVRVCGVGLLQALVFGVVCEESLSDPVLYIRNIVTLTCALPLGLLLSSIIPWRDLLIATSINTLAFGALTAVAISHMMAANDQLSSTLFISASEKHLPTILKGKAALFVVGFVTATLVACI